MIFPWPIIHDIITRDKRLIPYFALSCFTVNSCAFFLFYCDINMHKVSVVFVFGFKFE